MLCTQRCLQHDKHRQSTLLKAHCSCLLDPLLPSATTSDTTISDMLAYGDASRPSMLKRSLLLPPLATASNTPINNRAASTRAMTLEAWMSHSMYTKPCLRHSIHFFIGSCQRLFTLVSVSLCSMPWMALMRATLHKVSAIHYLLGWYWRVSQLSLHHSKELFDRVEPR